MAYATVRDIRVYNYWNPIQVTGDQLKRVKPLIYETSRKAIVDFDFDNIITDDVVVYVDSAPAQVAGIEAERGLVTLAQDPGPNATVTADYFYHPISDSEISLAIGAAEAEVDLLTGYRFAQYNAVERHTIYVGDEFRTRAPIISINSIKIYSRSGTLINSNPQYIIVDKDIGLVRLVGYMAGIPVRPFFLPAQFDVEIDYVAGYSNVPDYIKEATILIATYHILLKMARRLNVAEDYTQVSMAFATRDEFIQRLEFIRREVERVKALLPKQVRSID